MKITRHQLVKQVTSRIEEVRGWRPDASDHSIASNVVAVFEDYVKERLGDEGLERLFASEDDA